MTYTEDRAARQPSSVLRRRLNRRHLLAGIVAALLFHGLIVLGFWLTDRIRIQDIGDWAGPVLVKIGAPEAPEAPVPDPGPQPGVPEEPQAPVTPPPDPLPADPQTEPAAPSAAQPQPDSVPAENPPPETNQESPPAPAETPPQTSTPSRVQGSEDGNNYAIDFEGSEEEVGRSYSLDYVTAYMPLPEYLPASIIDDAERRRINGMTQDDLLRYWTADGGGWEYRKKEGLAGFVPYEERPFLWSYLQALGYDVFVAEWRSMNLRPVVVTFSVDPPSGSRGAFLSGIEVVESRNDERITNAVVFALSQWNFYNRTDEPINGRLTYTFDDSGDF